jgi:hypothetical protein
MSLEPLGTWVDEARVLAAQRNVYRLLQPDGSFTFVSPRELASGELPPRELAPRELAPRELAPRELASGELAWRPKL